MCEVCVWLKAEGNWIELAIKYKTILKALFSEIYATDHHRSTNSNCPKNGAKYTNL